MTPSPAKNLLLHAYYRLSLPLRLRQRRRAAAAGTLPLAVLFYHRVADDLPSPWTISNRLFTRQIDWLQRHFELISLAEVRRRILSGVNRRPAVSITFDDGYADNCRHALPLLVERGIPCTYFVTVENVLGGKPFRHDVARGDPPAPNSLAQLRWLAAVGVEIGAHSRTHADLGALVDAERLEYEVAGAGAELQAALGRRVRYFAFPFGQPANLSAAAFAVARQFGYEAVCSASGGYNLPGGNAFHLQRIPGGGDMIHLQNWTTIDPRKLRQGFRDSGIWGFGDERLGKKDEGERMKEEGRSDEEGRSSEAEGASHAHGPRPVGSGELGVPALSHGPRSVGVGRPFISRLSSLISYPSSLLRSRQRLPALEDRGPLRVMFLLTSVPVGGAETLLVELTRRLDRARFLPEFCCLKDFGPLGEKLALEIPGHAGLLRHKHDLTVLPRLVRLLRRRRIEAVVTVGAGDKMFWGRLAAWWARVPVICAALHSTGAPDRVGRLNRLLAPLTDAFIAVAESQARHLARHEGCPAGKVRVIPNGVDVDKFRPRPPSPRLREELGLPPGAPVAGIVAALRPEKNHELFLRAAAIVHRQLPQVRFLVVGDGPRKGALETLARELALEAAVRFAGTRADVPELLALVDVLVLTSHVEASPISLLEAMASEKPVLSTRVGSIPESVEQGKTGYLVEPGAADELAGRMIELLQAPQRAAAMGRAGREYVLAHASVERMVAGYQDLLAGIYAVKAARGGAAAAVGGTGVPPVRCKTPAECQ